MAYLLSWRRLFWLYIRLYIRPNNICRCRHLVTLVAAVTLSICWVGYVVRFNSDNSIHLQTDLPQSHIPRRPRTPRPTNSPPLAVPRDPSPAVIQPNEPCKPAETLRRRDSGIDGRWFNFGKPPFNQFFAYSAIWDDRPSPGEGLPLVRVLAISTSASAAVMNTVPVPLEYSVYCRFHMPDGRWLKPVSVRELALPIGYGWWLNDILVREFIYDCPPSRNEGRPDAVTMLVGTSINSTLTEMDDPKTTACVPVEYPEKPTVRRDFAVCLQVTYGTLNPLQLIEWLEFQRILGVEMIGIYNMSIDEGPAAQVLRYYTTHRGVVEGKGFVEMRRSDYIADGPSQFLLHGAPAINDCMYRNMYRFRHIIVVDLDEFIVPQAPLVTLGDMVAELERAFSTRDDPPVNYIFANNYFFTDFPPAPQLTTTQPARNTRADTARYDDLASRLMTLRYRWRAPLSAYGYAVKSIVDPMACVRMHNHYCWAVTTAYENRGYIELIPDTVAVNQHYKQCHLNGNECTTALKQATLDIVTMGRHRDKLVANVVGQIRAIFGLSPSEFLKQFT